MATQVVDAIARCSLADVERLTRKNAIASLGVSVIAKADALDWQGHTNLGGLEAVPKEFHRFIHDSVSLYVLETSATRNKLSLKFHEYLWRMLEALTYGLAINPQTGECDLFPDKRT